MRAHQLNSYVLTVVAEYNEKSEQHSFFEALSRLPFTEYEMGQTRAELPITAGIAAQFPQKPLKGFGILLTIHHMTDFLVLLETLVALGADPKFITVIDKEYPYAYTKRVDGHLTRVHDVSVRRYSAIEAAVEGHYNKVSAAGRRSIIMDDGGYVLPVVMNALGHTIGHWVGLVEQTMSGIWKLDKLPVDLPIFSVAQSEIKGAVESYGIADAAIRNVVKLLPNEKFEGQAALVLGFGRIGQQVARILRSRRMRVAVYDKVITRLLAAHEEGFITRRTLDALARDHRPLLIVGSAGRRSFTGNHATGLRRDTYLVSTTSRDYEFSLDELQSMSSSVEDLGILGTRFRLNTGITVTAVGHGMPINFHYAESLSNRYVDIVMAALLIGAVSIATGDTRLRRGIDVAGTDEILLQSGVIEEYYRRYGPVENELALADG